MANISKLKVNGTTYDITATKLNNRGNQTAITTKEEVGMYLNQVYNNGYPCSYGNVMTAGGSGGGQLLLGWSGTDKGIEHLYYRNRRDAITLWSDWRTLAFTTDNVASATRLQTARTINIQDSSATNTGTGASFDGSGNATIKLPATIKANLTGNADNATKWNGLINDLSTENNTDTWIPVLKDNKLQHTTKANMAVGQATRDSAGQQINTTYIKGLSISNNALIYTKGNGTTGHVDLIPAGTMQMFAGNTIPAGWLLCDGSAVSRTTYAKLFSAIGTTWGAGDGRTTFNLPNSVGRFAEGSATSGSYKSAGLPNITGAFGANEAYWFARCGNRGALTARNSFETNDRKYANALNPNVFNANFLGANDISIDASKSSSVYGNSTTVQPPSFTVKYIIKY